VERAGRELAAERGLAFAPVQGFQPGPMAPALENKIGREVTGVMRGENISWQFGRARTPWHWGLGDE
jgi:hypothetical protein